MMSLSPSKATLALSELFKRPNKKCRALVEWEKMNQLYRVVWRFVGGVYLVDINALSD